VLSGAANTGSIWKGERMRFYTTLKLGPNRSITPEGFTLFTDVSIARTGEQIYGPGETQIEPGPDGLVHIFRTPEEVFKVDALASCNGKALVIDHPDEDVRPHNWKYLANGVMFDAHRGSGEQKDEVVANVLVTTNEAIAEIDSGKREVSLGYDADYFQTGEGRGEQRNIIVNHVALVEAGRCGGRCAIRDHKPKGACNMKKSFKDRLLEAFKSKDEDAIKKIAEEIPEEAGSGANQATHIHVHTADKAKDEEEDPSEKRFKKIENAIEKLCKDKTKDEESEEEKEKKKKAEDKARDEEEEKERKKAEDAESEEMAEEVDDEEKEEAKKAKDSAFLSKAFEDVKMKAEIIAPGVKLPTFDSAAKPNKTFRDCICGLRRRSLQLGTADSATAALIDQVRGKATDSAIFLKMPCKDVRTVFNSVAALKKAQNNSSITRDGGSVSNSRDQEEPTPMQKFKAASDKRWGIGGTK
jgi:flagellar biosynthesis GTPase FlhF